MTYETQKGYTTQIPEIDFNDDIIRKCYRCSGVIGFLGFKYVNIAIMSGKQLRKIWTSLHVQLLCCTCYGKELKKTNITKKRARLIAKAERIWHKFGLDL